MKTSPQGKDSNPNMKKNNTRVLPPYNWNFLNKFNIKKPPKIQLYRDFETNARYLDFTQSLIKREISINEHLKEKFFGGLHYFKEYRFLENEYPYNIDKNIKHYNLWFNPKIIHNTTDKRIILLLKFILKNTPFIVFKNIPTNMSVQKIQHYHVFFKG